MSTPTPRKRDHRYDPTLVLGCGATERSMERECDEIETAMAQQEAALRAVNGRP